MPDIVKQITIGNDTRDIAAKYDINKNEIISTYAKQADVYSKEVLYTKEECDNKYQQKTLTTPLIGIEGIEEKTTVEDAIDGLKAAINNTRASLNTDFVNKDDLEKAVEKTIDDLVKEGNLTVKATQTKRISFQNGITEFSISATENYNKHLKVVIFNSKVSDSNATGVAYLDYDEEENTPTLALSDDHFANGATFEIYKNVLVATTSQGNTSTLQSTQSNWSTFSLSKQDKDNNTFSVMVYEEGWEENNPGGN